MGLVGLMAGSSEDKENFSSQLELVFGLKLSLITIAVGVRVNKAQIQPRNNQRP